MVTIGRRSTAYAASLPFERRWMSRSQSTLLPFIRRFGAGDFPIRLEPLSLIHVSSGELSLPGTTGLHRIATGEILALRRGDPIDVDRMRGSGEALLLHAPPIWVERAGALFGAGASPGPGDDIARASAGSEVARRTARLLLSAHLERTQAPLAGAGDGIAGIGGAGRMLELVGVALALHGPLDAARPPDGSRTRSRRAELVRTLEEFERAALDNLSLRVLAEKLRVSERQASRLLREALGTAFLAYVTSLRIERAKKQLATTDEPVTDIALETGWQSISHFNAVFRRCVGVTPSHYRARQFGERPARAAN